jgi:hypothetical protein
MLRISSDDLPGKHLLIDAVQEPVAEPAADEHSLKDAVAVYLRLKGHDRPPIRLRSQCPRIPRGADDLRCCNHRASDTCLWLWT